MFCVSGMFIIISNRWGPLNFMTFIIGLVAMSLQTMLTVYTRLSGEYNISDFWENFFLVLMTVVYILFGIIMEIL